MGEAPALVAGLDDVAVMGEAVEQGRGHLRVAEHGWALAEGKVRGDCDRGDLVELADEMEQQLSTGLREEVVAEALCSDRWEP